MNLFSPQSDGPSSSSLSGSHLLSDWCMNSRIQDSPFGEKVNDNWIDELNLSRNFDKMYIRDDQEYLLQSQAPIHSPGNPINRTSYNSGHDLSEYSALKSLEDEIEYYRFRASNSDYLPRQCSVPSGALNFNGEKNPSTLELQHGYRLNPFQVNGLFSQSSCSFNSSMSSLSDSRNDHASYYTQRRIPDSNLATSTTRPSVAEALYYGHPNLSNIENDRSTLTNMHQVTHPRSYMSVDNKKHYQDSPFLNGKIRMGSSIKTPQGPFETYTGDDSLIIQGDGLSVVKNGFGSSRGVTGKTAAEKLQESMSQKDRYLQFSGICKNVRSPTRAGPFSMPLSFNSAEGRHNMYFVAKDQLGCLFLQRELGRGLSHAIQTIYNGTIAHVVELMMDPYGNFVMQKLLDVCNDEQRIQILHMVTNQPGKLVGISLNSHGTRVVQKLIENLKTKQQITIVISALRPKSVALIKDLNGKHVILRCLQCLSNEDNEFIFVAATKYCVEIATHHHGIAMLQDCIKYSTGVHRENLVAEICANGLLFAQDTYGNYAVQYILDLKIPCIISSLVSQFEGYFVHLSTQMFSSHVVEKCLQVANDNLQDKIIHEMISDSHFEQMLQHPNGNYVVQTALRVSQGHLHNLLVDAVEAHRETSRNGVYSKWIFSHKHSKKRFSG